MRLTSSYLVPDRLASQVQLYNRKINIGDRDLFERGLKHEATDENEQAIVCYTRAGENTGHAALSSLPSLSVDDDIITLY